MNLSNLPPITFAEKDPQKIKSGIIARYQELSKRTLGEADPVMTFINVLTAEFVGLRSAIDFAAKQNLLPYAIDDYLDQRVVDFGLERNKSEFARVTMLFTMTQALTKAIVIPKNTQVTADSKIFFAVQNDVTVPIGAEEIKITCVATVGGSAANGYVSGQITQQVNPIAYVGGVVNLDDSVGGADKESNEDLRERRFLAPAGLSTAGPDDAYIYFAKSASSAVADVQVDSKKAGVVDVIVLMDDGRFPTDAELELIYAAVSPKNRRPLTDKVVVMKPVVVDYQIEFTFWISSRSEFDTQQIAKNVEATAQQFIFNTKTKLGKAVSPSDLAALLMATGVRRIDIANPKQIELTRYQVANNTNLIINFGGIEEDY